MKAKLRSTTVAAAMLLMPAAATFLALPGSALAAPAPQINALSVNSDEGLRPGADLQFSLQGTPRSRARVSLGRTDIAVNLRETAPGQYRGTYTVRSRDRIDPTAMITARLTSGNSTLTRNFSYPPSFQALAMGAPSAPPVPVVAAPRIDQFVVQPLGRLEPGRELRFRVNGPAGANASVDIPGVVSGIAMREVSPGVYEGAYTIRQRDDMDAFQGAVATLRSGSQSVQARVTRLHRDQEPPTVVNISPRPGEVISAQGSETISGSFEDQGGRGGGIDPSSVRITVSGRDVTPQSQVTPQGFSYRGDLPPGRHTVEVSAADRAGNSVRKTWSFDVGVPARVGAAPTVLPLQVTYPSPNAQIDANGNLRIQGRTAPWAQVGVRVEAVAPVFGNRLGVAQQVANETVQADRDGYFSVNLAPRGALPIPGTRYDVSLTANQGTQSAEQRLTIYQRQG